MSTRSASAQKVKPWATSRPGKRGKRSDGGFLGSLEADRASAKLADAARKPKKELQPAIEKP